MSQSHYSLCLRRMRLPARLGVLDSEQAMPQMIELDLELVVDRSLCNFDTPEGVPCYARLAEAIRCLVMAEHTPLCEQLAEKIAACCFRDRRIARVRLSLTKPDAVAGMRAGIMAEFDQNQPWDSA